MRNKEYEFVIGATTVIVEAEQEGSCRYMVRLSIPGRMARVRIGYLTGAQHVWLAEFFGMRPPQACTSAKDACRVLAEAAAEQNGISRYFVDPACSA